MMRVLCLWFPLWPIQRLRSVQPDLQRRPLALYDATPRGERLAVCSPLAIRHGLRSGMSLAEAETLAGQAAPGGKRRVELLPSDPPADRDALLHLALECQAHFSPMTALEEEERPECLFLDIRGCAHLFQGERELVREVVQFLKSRDWRVRCALTETLGAAWALAHFAERSVTLAPPGDIEAALQSLPLAGLRLSGKTLLMLDELGLERIGQLLQLRPAELASRFDAEVVRRIRQALGREVELLTPVRAPEPLWVGWSSEEATSDRRVLEQFCESLIHDLLAACQARGRSLLQYACELEGPRQKTARYVVDLISPSNDARHLLNLMMLQWDRQPFPGAVHAIRIEASRVGSRAGQSGILFDAGRMTEDHRAVSRLVERLSSRLGKTAVVQSFLLPDAQPEYAVGCQPWLESKEPQGKSALESPLPSLPWERPLTLLSPASLTVWSVVPDGPPQRVHWRQQFRGVVRWWGPERIETGWWRSGQCRREYYRVELETGEWLWIFRNRPEGDWRLQGIFD